MIRDRLILGTTDSDTRARTLRERELDLNKIIRMLNSGGARKFFLPGHYRGTTFSNGAHLMTCTETAIGHANPGLFQTRGSGFRVCHQFNMPSLWDALTAWNCGFFSCDLYNFI